MATNPMVMATKMMAGIASLTINFELLRKRMVLR
jgi:hypothetical protein